MDTATLLPRLARLFTALAGVVACAGFVWVYINIMWRCFRLYETAQICNSNRSKCTEIKRFASMI